MKKCITCTETKPESEYSLRRSGGTALRNECKQCHAKRERERRAGKLQKKQVPKPTGKEKMCTGCGEEKDLIYFDKNPSSSDGVHSRCKPCRAKSNAAYILNHGQEERGQSTWYQSIHPPGEMIIPAVIQQIAQR